MRRGQVLKWELWVSSGWSRIMELMRLQFLRGVCWGDGCVSRAGWIAPCKGVFCLNTDATLLGDDGVGWERLSVTIEGRL